MKRESLPIGAIKFGDERAAIRRTLMVIEFDLDGFVLTANDLFLEAFGYQLSEIIGRHHSVFVDASERNGPEYASFWDRLTRGEHHAMQYRRIGKNGRSVWIQASYSPILDTAGNTYKIIKFATDITDQKIREADFSGQVDAIRRALLVVEFSLDGFILDANSNFLKCFGYHLDEIKGRHHSIFVPDGMLQSEEYQMFWNRLRDGQHQAAQFMRLDKQQRPVWIQASYSPILDPSGRPYKIVKYATDITRQKEADRERETEIRYSAHHDKLTSLHNRLGMEVYVNEQVTRASQAGRWIAILLIDLDGFKAVNDNYGHAIGDSLLRAVALRMESAINQDDFVARLGGDEFAVVMVLPTSDVDAPLTLARKIQAAINTPLVLKGQSISVKTSIGLTIDNGPSLTVDKLIDNADAALYHVKEHGRNNIMVFDKVLEKATKDRREMELLLTRAISNHEIYLNYQPIVSTKTGQLVGLEALCRWTSPVLGAVSPAVFIPLAEKTGLINNLGEWIINEAVTAAANWPEHLFVSINVSPKQLGNNSIVCHLDRILEKTGVDPQRVELEVTETVLIEQNEQVLAELFKLRDLKVKISLDDFGTGFSSLSYLKMFPFHKIKIDRSFITDLQDNRESSAIVFASALLANQLEILVTAEGVETKQQLELVTLAGCDTAQGYFFGASWDGKLAYEETILSRPVFAH